MEDRYRLSAGNLRNILLLALSCLTLMFSSVSAAELADTIEKIKPSVVGVGSVQKTRSPPAQLHGTGFAVGNGLYIVTNAHVVEEPVKGEKNEHYAVFVGTGADPEIREARKLVVDEVHDLVLLEISGAPLPALEIGNSEIVREGITYAFTGFPIGAVLGLYPATHTGIVSAKTPLVAPMDNAKQIKAGVIKHLRKPYNIFQLDATAFPGNSGSPMYDPETGLVFGVLNKVFVQKAKESALTHPSGISYAIPSEFILDLLLRAEQPAKQ